MVAKRAAKYRFDLEKYFPLEVFEQITAVRVKRPSVILQEAQNRKKRSDLTTDGKLVILAADHPARMVTRVGSDTLAMGDRRQYLGRVLRVLASPGIDGVMGTTDIIEDLFIINRLMKEAGGESFLDKKVLLGCTNRTGLAGAAWELDDKMSSFTPESLELLNLDGAKLMVRICLKDESGGVNRTLEACAKTVSECNERGLYSFLEPLPVMKIAGKFAVQGEAEALAKVVGVASALGDSSRYLWLKIPYCKGYEKVARATTLPCLMLGGESKGDPSGIFGQFATGMQAGASIRGVLVGRNVTFPGGEDPLAVARAVNGIVHEGWSEKAAAEKMVALRDEELEVIAERLC